MKRLERWVVPILALLLCGGWLYGYAFNAHTCGGSETAMLDYLAEDLNLGKEVVHLKTAQEGRIKAILFDRTAMGDHCIAIFQRRLFGLRWEYKGMNGFELNGDLNTSGAWHLGGIKGSSCDVEVFGDNRDGTIGSYTVSGHPEISREDLESDYILDIYILDGIDGLPERLEQFGRDGKRLEDEA